MVLRKISRIKEGDPAMKSSRIDLSQRKGERGGVVAYTVLSALFLFLAAVLFVGLGLVFWSQRDSEDFENSPATGPSEQ